MFKIFRARNASVVYKLIFNNVVQFPSTRNKEEIGILKFSIIVPLKGFAGYNLTTKCF